MYYHLSSACLDNVRWRSHPPGGAIVSPLRDVGQLQLVNENGGRRVPFIGQHVANVGRLFGRILSLVLVVLFPADTADGLVAGSGNAMSSCGIGLPLNRNASSDDNTY